MILFDLKHHSTSDIYILSLHDALPIYAGEKDVMWRRKTRHGDRLPLEVANSSHTLSAEELKASGVDAAEQHDRNASIDLHEDRKSTRLNSSHLGISYAVFCLKKKTDKK